MLAASVSLAEPVLHEYFDFDGDETAGSSLAGGSQPDVSRPASSREANAPPSRSAPQPDAQKGKGADDDSYQLDSNTTRPDQVGYDDPFTPAIPPFKRMFAYDSVDARFELIVNDPRLFTMGAEAGAATADEDQFFGDLAVTLRPGEPERIPSVGAGARLLAVRFEPAVAVEVQQDSAQNWFVVATERVTASMTMHLAIDRRFFGSEFGDPEWRDLGNLMPEIPASVKRRGLEVADNLGVSRGQRPQQALMHLVSYFRSFSPSEDLPRASDPGALYREIALSKKGVCRHRSYAFTVTALALGLPTRFVRNEAHAWVEVHDAEMWHRIDLGGAAGEMQLASTTPLAHVPPTDPYDWPENSESARDMTDAALSPPNGALGDSATRGGGDATGRQGDQNAEEDSDEAAEEPSETDATPSAAPTSMLAPQPFPSGAPVPAELSEVTSTDVFPSVELESHSSEVRQGERVQVSGRVEGTKAPCSLVRVDVVLRSSDRTLPVGSLVTDASGRYAGAITLPGSVPVGDYELVAVPHGADACGASPSR